MYHDLSMFETSSNKSILLGYSACSSSGLTIGLWVRVKRTNLPFRYENASKSKYGNITFCSSVVLFKILKYFPSQLYYPDIGLGSQMPPCILFLGRKIFPYIIPIVNVCIQNGALGSGV